jgi:hypothetical protein
MRTLLSRTVKVLETQVRWILASRRSQLLDVENVLLTSTCEFILDEVIFGYNGWDFAVDKALDAIFPGLIEIDAIDVLQNAHSAGGWPIWNTEPSIKSAGLRPSRGAPYWVSALSFMVNGLGRPSQTIDHCPTGRNPQTVCVCLLRTTAARKRFRLCRSARYPGPQSLGEAMKHFSQWACLN